MANKNIVGLLIGFLGCMLGLYGVIYFNQLVLMSLPLALRMIAMIVMYWLIAAIPIGIMCIYKDKLSDYGFQNKKITIQIIIGTAIGLAMSIILTVVPHLAGFGEYVNSGKQYKYLWQFIYEFIYCIFAIGCVEEFVFRGFLYQKVQAIFRSEVVPIITTSVLFGIFHLFSGSVMQMIMTAFIGAFFCICRSKVKNCSTLSLIFAHGIYDALITVWAYVLL